VRAALRLLQGHALDRLASHVETVGDWNDLAVTASTRRELELLELRCRHRERLVDPGGTAERSGLAPGVRALFTGPSGSGKTLAARLLASVLRKDLYAVDLATIVDKYLGETEKNLEEILSRAEELDVVLLLDEGDALLGQRTDVRSSNDRYANLETNFLLQRLEVFDGVVVVTTNAGERIDPGFRRRIDVVVQFRMPDAADRWALWHLHLPYEHDVDTYFLEEVAARCTLTGGQIRNAVLHASLLAVERARPVGTVELEDAVRREYRKAGAACPLRTRNGHYG
jgi:SpoVK/Ycf46/Vps4 family AAA+-type ATPase